MSAQVLIRSAEPPEAVREYLTQALKDSQTIAPMPRVCAQLAEMEEQQALDAAHLARLIQSDPALAGEVMRVANSPAMRPRAAIVSLQQAAAWLGVGEVRNIAMSVMLRAQVFASDHKQLSQQLWFEASLAGLWAKEIARVRRKQVETAFLAALMHRAGAALALTLVSRFEKQGKLTIEVALLQDLLTEYETDCGRSLMIDWGLSEEVRNAALDWRHFGESTQAELAATVHAAHALSLHTLDGVMFDAETVLANPAFEALGIFPDDRVTLLDKRELVKTSAGLT